MVRILQWGMHGNTGGVETFLFNLYKNIDREKVQFDFLIGHDAEIAFEKEILEMGGRIYRVTYAKKESFVKSYSELDKFLKEHKEISGIHMHSCFVNYSLPLRLARKHKIPIRIFHSQNGEDMYPTKSIIKKFYREIERKRIVSNATDLFACSEQAGKYAFKNVKYKWIKNGTQCERYKFNELTRKQVRHRFNIQDDIKVIGFVGRLQYQKNPLFMLDVFNEYFRMNKNTVLFLIGDGEMKHQLMEKIERLGIKRNVFMLGNRSDLFGLYQAMDLLLFPSLFEGLPVTIVEAQASGLPCLISDTITDKVKASEYLFFADINRQPHEWAERIEEILLDDIDRKKDYEKVKEVFDMKSIAKEMENYYLEHSIS